MNVSLAPSAILWLSVLFYLDGKLLLPFFLAAAVHELGHLLALRRMGHSPGRIVLRFTGAAMEIPALSYRQELLAAAAGPLASLLLGALLPLFPAFGLYSLILGLFNLLPIPGLDGGRILRCAALLALSPDAALRLCRLAALVSALGLWALGLWLALPKGLGLWPLLVAGLFLFKALVMEQ